VDFNPEMLILARESRRMTQKLLAEASNTTQASVSRAEAGVHHPHQTTVEAWATALRYPVAFFARRNDAPPLPRTHWRKRAKLSKTDQKALEAWFQIHCMHLDSLARSVELPSANVPALTIGEPDAKSPVFAAQYLRSLWNIPPGPIEDLSRTVEDNGIVVVRVRMVSFADGISAYDLRRGLPPVMLVSADVPGDRMRWTMAHELAHIVLHHHLRATPEDCEEEADEFASEFLMPAHEIRHQFSARTNIAELAQLKLFWRTSMASLLRRGVSVGRITDAHATRLWKQLSVAGYRKHEPNEIEQETPTLLQEMMRVHVEELGYSIDDLATFLTTHREDVRAMYLGELEGPDRLTGRPHLRLVE
jgi:Zn-dependent peptidase ImmA (M78 family)/transcriptional regulator with XRE-family HTH domain